MIHSVLDPMSTIVPSKSRLIGDGIADYTSFNCFNLCQRIETSSIICGKVQCGKSLENFKIKKYFGHVIIMEDIYIFVRGIQNNSILMVLINNKINQLRISM